jgi:spore germination protein GerM
MRRAPTFLVILSAVGLTTGPAACGERRPDAAGGETAEAAAPAADPGRAPDPAPRAELRSYDTVFVYFDGPTPDGVTRGPLVPRARAVPDTGALTFALAELLAGPSETDTAAVGTPLYSWFSEETAGMLERVELVEGAAIVELEDLRPVIPGASSSAGSAALLRQLKATAFQFPEVRRVEFRIDGSCEAFMAWLQVGCVPIPRASFTAPEGYREAVAGEAASS